MGRIKSTMIKKAARQLSLSDSDKFTTDFNHNKKILQGSKLPSKSTRNKIAGYISRVIRMRSKPKPVVEKPVEEEQYNY